MDLFLDLGISMKYLKMMTEVNEEIKDLEDNEIKEKIEILRLFDLNDKNIRHIIISNPLYLSRTSDDIKDLLKKLNELGFNDFNLIFDTNPYLLNNDSYEIDEYIEEKQKQGKMLDEILAGFESNFYIID